MIEETIVSSSTIPKGKSFYAYLINANLEGELPCLGSSIILEYNDMEYNDNNKKQKKCASFFYMPEFEVFKSYFIDNIEAINLNGRKILNLEFQKNKKGFYVGVEKTDVIKRPMSSPISLFSGNYAKEYMNQQIYSTIDKFLK